MVQQLTVRLSVFTGRSYVKLVREYFGLSWVWLVVAALAIATLDSLVRESPPSPASVSDHHAVIANWIWQRSSVAKGPASQMTGGVDGEEKIGPARCRMMLETLTISTEFGQTIAAGWQPVYQVKAKYSRGRLTLG
jgi:hypothetical protein